MTKMEMILLLAAALILLYFGARQCGMDPVQVTDETEIVDDPHKGY